MRQTSRGVMAVLWWSSKVLSHRIRHGTARRVTVRCRRRCFHTGSFHMYSVDAPCRAGSRMKEPYVCCFSVCLSTRITRKPHGQTPTFCAWRFCRGWLSSFLTVLRYVMHFRFYGLRHVFILWANGPKSSTTLFRRSSPGGGTIWTLANFSV